MFEDLVPSPYCSNSADLCNKIHSSTFRSKCFRNSVPMPQRSATADL